MNKQKYSLILAILALIGILATMGSNAISNPTSPLASASTSLKFFTIQSNIIVMIYFFMNSTKKYSSDSRFQRLLGAVTAYITITFLVFVTMLQSTWHPDGLAQFGNILNHYVVPTMTIAFLVLFRKDYRFVKKDILIWMIYPLAYVTFLLIHGLITGDYIYPFFEIDELGIGSFLIAFLGIMALFFVLSIGEVFLTKKKS